MWQAIQERFQKPPIEHDPDLDRAHEELDYGWERLTAIEAEMTKRKRQRA